jgi:hypothetical protein
MGGKSQRGRSELSSGSRVAIRNNLVLLAVLCFTLMSCGGPDYTKPESDGKKLPTDYPDLIIDYHVTATLPSPLKCDTVYKITVKVLESGAKCTGYNFTKLFNLATSLVASRATSLTCQNAACSPLQQRKSSMRWNCKEEVGASLELQVSLICPTKGATLPDDHNPTAQEFTQDDFHFPPNADPTQGADEVITQTIYLSRPCPEKTLRKVVYEEKLPNFATLINPKDCASLKNQPVYQPYAKQGEDLAKAYYNSFACDTPCKKAPFQVFRQEWDCDKNTNSVVIKTYFYVDCQK